MEVIDTDFGSFTVPEGFAEWMDKLDPNWRNAKDTSGCHGTGKPPCSQVDTKPVNGIVDVVQRIFSPASGR